MRVIFVDGTVLLILEKIYANFIRSVTLKDTVTKTIRWHVSIFRLIGIYEIIFLK